ncbi:hypothetical protein SBADM41S_11748 [Streptomyces badius]
MQTRKQARQPLRGALRIRTAVGAGALVLVLAGCGGSDEGAKGSSVERTLALMDDQHTVDAGDSLDVDVLDNDSITLESGVRAGLLDAYDPAELTLTIDTEPNHGSASVSSATMTYTAREGYRRGRADVRGPREGHRRSRGHRRPPHHRHRARPLTWPHAGRAAVTRTGRRPSWPPLR